MSNHPLHLLSDEAKAAGCYRNLTPNTRGSQFIDNSKVTTSHPNEPLYYLVEHEDADQYAAGLDGKHPKTTGLQTTLNLSTHYIVKSLIMYDTKTRNPLCILMHSDYTVNTRLAAKVVKAKQVQPMPIDEANATSGYIVGGTSGFGLKTPMPVIIQDSLLGLDWIVINGGGHYRYIVIRPENLKKVFESEYSLGLGFTPHVASVGKVRPKFALGEDDGDEQEEEQSTEQTQQQPPTNSKTPHPPLNEIDQIKSIQNELMVLCNAYDSNNLSDQHILLTDTPREHLLLFQPTPYPLKLLQHTGLIEQHLIAQQVPFEATHFSTISVPIFTASAPSSPRADIRTILLKFECTVPRSYPNTPLSNLKLSAYKTSDFYSIFDVDGFLASLNALATNCAKATECSILQCIEYIADNHALFFRQNLSSLHSPSTSTSTASSLSILQSPQLTGAIRQYTDSNVSGVPPPNPILTSKTAPLSMSTAPSTIYSAKPIITQQYKATPIDAVEFCAVNEITTIHPFIVYQHFLNGTFSLDLLEELTPNQRLAIYHTSLLGRITKPEGRNRLREEAVQDFNKLKSRLGPAATVIPEAVARPSTSTHVHSGDSLADIIRKAYSNLVLPKTNPISLINDTQFILQPSSDLQQVNVMEGEVATFIQKKHGSIKVGLVGLPNVGKSSLYNLLCSLSVPASNYAFCTIDPNLCKLPIVDQRFEKLVKHSKKSLSRGLGVHEKLPILPPELSIVDIAGIVKNACVGKGLGNAFLHHISTVHVIYQVIRCFDDSNTMDNTIEHVENSVNPIRDIEIINQELIEKDIEQFYKRIARMQPPGKVDRFSSAQVLEENEFQLSVLLKAHTWLLETNRALRFCTWTEQEAKFLSSLQTWTAKPVCYILNMSIYQYCDPARRNTFVSTLTDYFFEQGFTDTLCVPISVVYEQARVLYQKRFVPLMGCDWDDLGIDFTSMLSPASPRSQLKMLSTPDGNIIPDYSLDASHEMLCTAALGREIQAARLNFSTSAQDIAPVVQTIAPPPVTSTTSTKKSDKEKDSKKHDKKDSKKEKRDDKKDKKKAFSSLDSLGDLGGGFSDFLGPSNSPKLSPKIKSSSHKKDKKEDKKDKKRSDSVSPALSSTSNPDIPHLSLHTQSTETAQYPPEGVKKRHNETEEQHQSTIFWTQVNQFLQTTPRLHSLLKQLVRSDENGESVMAPSKAAAAAARGDFAKGTETEGDPECDTKIDFDTIDDDNKNNNNNDDETNKNDDSKQSTEQRDQTQTDENGGEDKDGISNQVKGKVLFIDYANPTPLASLITSACSLARVVQFYIASSQFIKGSLIPANVTTAFSASIRIDPKIYNNFHSAEVIHYADFIRAQYSLAKCRELGVIVTHNKNYIVQDGDIVNFKCTKQTK